MMEYIDYMKSYQKYLKDAEEALIRAQILEDLGQSTQAKASAADGRNLLEMAAQALKTVVDEIDQIIE